VIPHNTEFRCTCTYNQGMRVFSFAGYIININNKIYARKFNGKSRFPLCHANDIIAVRTD